MIIINLTTTALKQDDIDKLLGLIEMYIWEIKNSSHNGALFSLEYWVEGEKVIDIRTFIDISIGSVINERSQLAVDYYRGDSLLRENIRAEVNLAIIKGLKKKFKFPTDESPPLKIINQFLKYLRVTAVGRVRDYHRNLSKLQQHNNYLINNAIRLGMDRFYYKEPETLLIEKENVKDILNYISSLPKKQRIALVENCFYGKSQKEIALLLGNSQQAVSRLIIKARANLKDKLKNM